MMIVLPKFANRLWTWVWGHDTWTIGGSMARYRDLRASVLQYYWFPGKTDLVKGVGKIVDHQFLDVDKVVEPDDEEVESLIQDEI